MPLATWTEYEEILQAVSKGSWKVIGWGAGKGFSNFHRGAPIRLDYLVDSDPAKWGTFQHGFEVLPPETIAREDPSRTVVVIYNFFDHGSAILSALNKIGPYKAMMNFHPSVLRTFVERVNAGIDVSLSRKKPADSDSAILVQGPLLPGITEMVVKYYACRYPNDWLIVSTWSDSPQDLIERIRPFCDRLLCGRPLAMPGIGNRNRQIVSTRAGVAEALQLGLSKIMKTRTDTLATADDILRKTIALQNAFSAKTCHAHGLSNRIVTIERYTMRYIPYRVSDILLFGDVKDMARFWETPLDNREIDSTSWTEMTFRRCSQERQATEIYLAGHFLENVGWRLKHTLEDYWAALRDIFIVTDERWFGHFFPRYDIATLDDGRDRFSGNSYIDFNFWFRIYGGLTAGDTEGIDLDKIRMRDTFRLDPIPVNSPRYRAAGRDCPEQFSHVKT